MILPLLPCGEGDEFFQVGAAAGCAGWCFAGKHQHFEGFVAGFAAVIEDGHGVSFGMACGVSGARGERVGVFLMSVSGYGMHTPTAEQIQAGQTGGHIKGSVVVRGDEIGVGPVRQQAFDDGCLAGG